MPKKNIAYIKPEEPSFLRKLKEQVGYQQGPSIDTKREDLGPIADEDLLDTAEEEPTIVVLSPGDLTAEEAEQEKERLNKEAEETPADLSVPIVFNARNKTTVEDSGGKSVKRSSHQSDKKKSKKIKNTTLLSFNEEENDD